MYHLIILKRLMNHDDFMSVAVNVLISGGCLKQLLSLMIPSQRIYQHNKTVYQIIIHSTEVHNTPYRSIYMQGYMTNKVDSDS